MCFKWGGGTTTDRRFLGAKGQFKCGFIKFGLYTQTLEVVFKIKDFCHVKLLWTVKK